MCAGTNTVEVTEIKPGLTQVSVQVCWYKHSGVTEIKPGPTQVSLHVCWYKHS